MLARLPVLVVLCCLLAVPAVSASDEPLEIDDYAYDQAEDCRKRPTPGALALVEWLERNAGGASWGILRCERWDKGSASLHAEGRAVDCTWTPRGRSTAARRGA